MRHQSVCVYQPTIIRHKNGSTRKCKGQVWWAKWTDAVTGQVQRESTGTKNKRFAMQYKALKEQNLWKGKVGLIDEYAPHRERPLAEHLADYLKLLEDRGRDSAYVANVDYRLTTIFEWCKFKTIGSIESDKLESCLAEFQRVGVPLPSGKRRKIGTVTRNAYLGHAKDFCNWLVPKRLEKNPISDLQELSEDGDLKHQRRTISADDFRLLIESTANSNKVILGMDGVHRAVLYNFVSHGVGFRRNHLGCLTPAHFHLDATPPYVHMSASGSSNKKRAALTPLTPSVAAMMSAWFASRQFDDGDRVFPIGDAHAASMLRQDLESAGLAYQNNEGLFFDFHALRAQAGTNMADDGVPMSLTSKVLCHSKIETTMKHYHRPELVAMHGVISAKLRAAPLVPGLQELPQATSV